MVDAIRKFWLICSVCKKETPFDYKPTVLSQNIMTYPRKGNCEKCGKVIFEAKIEAKVK